MPRTIALIGGAAFGLLGLFALLAPASFYDFATYPPYNVHFIRDIGAFMLGTAAVLLLAAFRTGALFVALAGAATGSWFHTLSHVMDRSRSANGTRDLLLTAVGAILLTVGAAAAAKERAG